MRDLNEETLTDEVIRRFANAGDARVREVSEALVRHLHAFVREVEPTEAEWAFAIDFLTRVGKMCDDTRQEFILLSDTLGVSMLVDAINHRMPEGASETTVLGPFYVQDPQEFELGQNLSEGVEGMPLYVAGSVSAEDGRPLADAVVDVWHSDGDGFYDVQNRDQTAMRGRLATDGEGRFSFWTVRPASYPIPDDGPVGQMLEAQGRHPFRPSHVHFRISSPDFATLTTHLFEQGDPYLDSDVVFGVKESLIRPFMEHDAGVAPDGRKLDGKYASLEYGFVLKSAS